MKSYGILCFVLILAVLICPICALDGGSFSLENVRAAFSGGEEENEAESNRAVRVRSAVSGNVTTTSELDYVIGCVAAELPPSYHEEALKAQAVAAYTNLRRLKKRPDKSLGDADVSDSPALHQGYWDETTRRGKWGKNYDACNEKLGKAVGQVLGQVLTWEEEPILAAYCELNSGRSESAANIWGSEVPYLKSVSSPGDRLSPDCFSEKAFSPDAFREAAAKEEGIVLPENPESWIGELVCSPNHTGVVLSANIGGKTLTGTKIRSLFGLRSPAFEVNFRDGSFVFKTAGSGHGVGMSQYGANFMAQSGSSYREILEHYYPGTKIEQPGA